MENKNELSKRFAEVLLNGKWIANTNYKELLLSINWKQATNKVGNLNTIAVLAQHINYYIHGVLHAFINGKIEIRDKFSFDFPNIDSKEKWNLVLNNLFVNAKKFTIQIEKMTDKQLDEVFINEKYGSNRRNIEAMIEHCYYHLGQISLLKKMIIEDEEFKIE